MGEAALAVVKLGGSLLFEDEGSLKEGYVRGFLRELREYLAESNGRVVVVVGGGRYARNYIQLGRRLGVNEGVLDYLGILVSRLNAATMYAAFYNSPPLIPETLLDVHKLLASGLRVVFMGGLQPGQSTTTTAALVAESLNGSLIIATDVEGIYTDDPKRNPAATLMERVSVEELRRMFQREQVAGEYRMIDVLSLNVIQRSKVKVFVLKGDPPGNIFRALRGERVAGTFIEA
ncbi:UMP kinase [Thermofilum pendens]|uniref:Uridylate kinase n=1 Tax=Thermofilum pendens (strain DSM 2475 / Hrk 5) TaxID=368408 RepID=PYRH_THEPD|nr:UMP kinase [Thermofilum pendens]A1RXJ4.1 RecName: Full=Uridylate kinase; Short=UK; AltName: Full=Uridine monophosphate kinase; Short=UMP kinase; Short=UMPK [Thermofilum pendens Hrk 5]ABL77924.1 uridylate kinase, putative [Thermofilum pendens Hrk 5]